MQNDEAVEAQSADNEMPNSVDIDLGEGISLQMCLVPSGQCWVGYRPPEPLKPSVFPWLVGGISVLLLLSFAVALTAKAWQKKTRPQWSLGNQIAGIVVAGLVLWSGLCLCDQYRDSVQHAELLSNYKYWMNVTHTRTGLKNERKLYTVEEPLYVGRFEVTNGEFLRVMGHAPASQPGMSRVPVTMVTYSEAEAFCRKLTKKVNKQFRLPTEYEWEYICRAGLDPYIWEEEKSIVNGKVAWIGGTDLHEVGELKPNTWGLFDMQGNALEWCSDVGEEGWRVVRGGHVLCTWFEASCAYRSRIEENRKSAVLGFRVVMCPKNDLAPSRR